MKNSYEDLKSLSVVLLIMISCQAIDAQSDTLASPATGNNKADAGLPKHALYAGGGYGSNMIYLGSTISQDQPFGYASLSYGFKGDLYLTASAVHLANLSPFAAFYSGSLGYSHTFNSWFDISAGMARYQVAPSLHDTLFSNFTYGDLTLGFDWKILYTKISAGGLFSAESRAYFQVKSSHYFQTPGFFNKKVNISFDPYFNLLFGKITTAETITGKVVTSFPPFRKRGNGSQTTTTTKYTESFGLMEADLGLPVALNTDRFTLEIEPGYVLPVYEDAVYPGTKGFLLLLSAYFRIF